VDIGTDIAYKHGDRPRGPSEGRRKSMAAKKPATKLKRAKVLKHTKPLTLAGANVIGTSVKKE
jgi:hypothetical protein